MHPVNLVMTPMWNSLVGSQQLMKKLRRVPPKDSGAQARV